MGAELYTAKQFIDAISGSGANITLIAERVGCSWNTAKKYIEEHPTVNAAYRAEEDAICDLAETVITTNIRLAAKAQERNRIADTGDARWWLAKKRRKEYGESLDLTTDGEKINVVLYLPLTNGDGENN